MVAGGELGRLVPTYGQGKREVGRATLQLPNFGLSTPQITTVGINGNEGYSNTPVEIPSFTQRRTNFSFLNPPANIIRYIQSITIQGYTFYTWVGPEEAKIEFKELENIPIYFMMTRNDFPIWTFSISPTFLKVDKFHVASTFLAQTDFQNSPTITDRDKISFAVWLTAITPLNFGNTYGLTLYVNVPTATAPNSSVINVIDYKVG